VRCARVAIVDEASRNHERTLAKRDHGE
jgi:hypothetical protein